MKAEINSENKAKFLSLYWDQDVMFSDLMRPNGTVYYNNMKVTHVKYNYLLLKPLSQISDEDAVGIPSIPNRTTLELLDYFCKKDHLVACQYLLESLKPQDYDFLRSRGYALPWMGISVQEQIEAGWVKFTEL